ncbi:hypothetical protein BTVI_105262 [Pitangus sulphuratus]|nr:hypothetical protein BTVI_105262 [Pitangus sulphuratus]
MAQIRVSDWVQGPTTSDMGQIRPQDGWTRCGSNGVRLGWDMGPLVTLAQRDSLAGQGCMKLETSCAVESLEHGLMALGGLTWGPGTVGRVGGALGTSYWVLDYEQVLGSPGPPKTLTVMLANVFRSTCSHCSV